MSKIYNNLVELVGNTPIIRLNKLGPANRTILLKLESFNPGGSVKDRIAKNMIEEAEASGALKPGDVIITLEANKNADLSVIPRMLALAENECDLVLASCYAPGGAVVGDPFTRLFLSKSINSLLQILFPFGKIHTYTSFFRLWTFDIVHQIHDATSGKYFRQEAAWRICSWRREKFEE